ncbi:NUDIX domain-containing protein [Vibrio parahaemolyticus]|nr:MULTISPECIES: HTH domain-containing protein [Vibrio]EHW0692025.1 NUDIX domain-containing protein [Vibrio parahaemolyticus]EIA1330043.1 NUDIX domain-containing protein [Vibrio parahaemolyticus]EII3144582.1 NUDIX domain-containing protein [Vibrio parahaemolyticus]EIU6800598.1 NUDIX domain-containing protein [Vibrio parahaemolyticus]EIV8672272.1 NUDIX domain-containing protein [Vibrio parahaemolyticus]
MTLLENIYEVLESADVALTDKQIEAKLREQEEYRSKSSNLVTQIRARLYTDIKEKPVSKFAVLAPNTFGLSSWLDRKNYEQYEPREKEIHKSHLDEVIAVFERSLLSELLPGNGLRTMEPPLAWFASNCQPMLRRDAEQSTEYIQLVSSFVITSGSSMFTHVRSGRAPESRLKGEKSILLGGHIEYDEVMQLSSDINFDLFEQAKLFTRELEEEVELKTNSNMKFIGCMYDDSRTVSSQHLSLLHHVELKSQDVIVKEKGYHINPEWIPIEELKIKRDEFENWSSVVIKTIFDVE